MLVLEFFNSLVSINHIQCQLLIHHLPRSTVTLTSRSTRSSYNDTLNLDRETIDSNSFIHDLHAHVVL